MISYCDIVNNLNRELKRCDARVSEKHIARERDFVDRVGCRLDVARSIDEVYYQAEKKYRTDVQALDKVYANVRSKKDGYVKDMLESVDALETKYRNLDTAEKRIRELIEQVPEAPRDTMQDALKKVEARKKDTADELEDTCDTVYLWFYKMGVQVPDSLRDKVLNTAMRSKINTTLYPPEDACARNDAHNVAPCQPHPSVYSPCTSVAFGTSAASIPPASSTASFAAHEQQARVPSTVSANAPVPAASVQDALVYAASLADSGDTSRRQYQPIVTERPERPERREALPVGIEPDVLSSIGLVPFVSAPRTTTAPSSSAPPPTALPIPSSLIMRSLT